MKLFKLLKNWKLVKYTHKKGFKIPLFSQGMLDYIDIHLKCGLPADIDTPNSKGEDIISKNVQYLEDIVSKPPLNGVKVIFEIIDDNSINAFAIEITCCKTPTYLVAINKGLVDEYSKHFLESLTIKEITKGFKALNQVPIEFLQEAALSLSFCFIAYHEMGHIFRGHLNYFREKNSVKAMHELSVNDKTIDDEDYNEARHLIECDADAFAGSLMAAEITSRHKKGLDSGLISGSSNLLLEELIIFSGSVIYYIFCLFDRNQTNFDGWYPVPPIRTSIALGHLSAQLFNAGVDEKRSHKLLIESLARTQNVIHNMSMEQLTKNLELETKRWSSKYMVKLSNLEKSLVPYAPVKK